MEVYQRACAQAPDSHGVRRTRWAVVRNCYDDQTEILTEQQGWKLFKDLIPEDRVATLQQGDSLVYEKPSYYYQADYEGEMIGVESDNLDLFITPNHKLYASRINGRTKTRSKFLFPKASEIYGKTNYEFKMDANWKGENRRNIGDEDFYEFLGFWFAEGSAGLYNYPGRKKSICRVVLTQKKNLEYVEDLLRRCKLEFHKNLKKDSGSYDYVLNVNEDVRTIAKWLVETGIAKNKHVPSWVKKVPRKFLKAFIHGYLMGDGHIKDGSQKITCAYTASRVLADDIQEIALKAGYAAVIHKRKNRQEYDITLLVKSRRSPNPRKENWYKKQYVGKVYCVEVSSHIVYVRRNGKPVWCSQTYPELRDTTIKTFLDWFPDKYFGHYRSNPTPDYTMFQKLSDGTTVESEILFRALDRPEHVKNLLSLEVTGAWLNEAREIPKVIFDAMDGRINRYPSMKDGGATWCGIFLDTNPCDTDHWLYKLFVEELPNSEALQEKYGYFHQPSGLSANAENLPYLPKGYYTDMALGKDANYIKVYIRGEYGYVREGKIIYSNYNDLAHCSETPLEFWRGLHLTLGWDFGLTPACVITQHHPKGVLHVLRELAATEMGVKRFARDVVRPFLISTFNGYRFVSGCDPSGARRSEYDETKSCYKELKEAGFPVKLAYSNDLEPRFTAVDDFLTKMIEGKPAFRLDPSCKLLRKGFNGEYKRKKLQVIGSEVYADSAEKNAVSHPHDALQYACMTIQRGITPTTGNIVGHDGTNAKQPPVQAYY